MSEKHHRGKHHHEHHRRIRAATVSEATVVPTRNGPYLIRGKLSIITPDGQVIESADEEICLCRCGQSRNKPFCDSTHAGVGFESDLDAEVPTRNAGGYEDVCAEQDVPEGELRGFAIGNNPVLLGRVEGQLYAIGGYCTHKQALLEGGGLDGFVVRCPRHPGAFDIRTGNAVRPPAVTTVPTYDVKVERGRVLVARQPR